MVDEWQETEIGKAFQVNPIRVIRRGQVTPFIPMDALPENARRTSRVDEREFTGSGAKFQNGDTLIARITPCLENGKTSFINCLPNGVVAHGSTEYIVLCGRKNETDNLFAYYLARSPDFRHYTIGRMEGSSGRQRVPSVAVENFRILLPPLREQRAIAQILGTLDDKIELNRRMNETLEAMARALFKSWFVDFEPVRAKAGGRDSDLPKRITDLFPARLTDSELGEIPEGWKVLGLDEIATYLNGLAMQKYPPEGDLSIPVIKIAQLRQGHTKGADRANANLDPAYVVQDGDVLFSWSGSLEVEIWCGGKGALNQHLFKVIPTGVPQWFAFLWTRHHLADFRLIAAGKATTMGHIQRHHLSQAKVLVPPKTLLKAMDIVLAPLVNRTTCNNLESHSLASIRDTLLRKLISGELRLKDAEKIAGTTL